MALVSLTAYDSLTGYLLLVYQLKLWIYKLKSHFVATFKTSSFMFKQRVVQSMINLENQTFHV